MLLFIKISFPWEHAILRPPALRRPGVKADVVPTSTHCDVAVDDPLNFKTIYENAGGKPERLPPGTHNVQLLRLARVCWSRKERVVLHWSFCGQRNLSTAHNAYREGRCPKSVLYD